MKLFLMSLFLSFEVFAQTPTQLARLDGFKGQFEMSPERGTCQVQIRQINGRDYFQVKTDVEWGTIVFQLDSLKPLSRNTFLTSSNGKRPGGDFCGDLGGMSGFKEYVQLSGNDLVITQKFRCWLKSEEIVRYCRDLK